MKQILSKLPALIGALIFSGQLFASYTCEGEVSGVALIPHSGVLVAERIGPLEWPHLCSVSKEYNRVSPATCKHIYSLLLTAQVSGKEVILWLDDGLNCSKESHKPWGDLTGWYFGPKLKD